MGDSKIYLGQDGQYHDDTDANRELYPAADAPAPEALADGGTLTESGSDVPPVTAEPDAPATATARTRKQ